MRTYAERVCFPDFYVETLSRTQGYVARVADTWGNELRCHELARAVQRVLDPPRLIVVDGLCGPVEHSWLIFGDGTILDPYVPGRLPAVQLIDKLLGSHYTRHSARRDIRETIVDRLVREMLEGGELG